MKFQHTLKAIAAFGIAFIVLTVMFSAAYFLTSFIYQTFDLRPAALLGQVVNAQLGLLLTLGLVAISAWMFSSRHRANEMVVFGPIINALEKIAKGDFSVQLDEEPRNEGLGRVPVFRDLVKSVNHLALELNQMESMRQEFISNVSHEIQSPLTSIRGFAAALQDAQLSPTERAHYLGIIESESTRLSRITDNLLQLASLESAQIKFEPKPYRLDKQIRRLILASEPQWTNKRLELEASLDDVLFTGDEDLMSQVWINLLHNSIKFTPEGGSIRVILCRQGERVVVGVSDTGIGISEEDQARVFERFYKADKARQRSQEGSGLGLSIARKILELHRGTIGLESTLGIVTTFTISLPAD